MKTTKQYKKDVTKAMRAAKSGNAYHWPTIAIILANEVDRLRSILEAQQTTASDSGNVAHLNMVCPSCGFSADKDKFLTRRA